MSFGIGKMRHRLALEAPSPVADGGGGAAAAWTQLAEISGAVLSMTGDELTAADRISGQRQVIVSIRHREDIVPAMRFRLGSRVLAIRAVVDPEGRGRYLRCLCEERDL